jgi:glycosyltransferase involved in cell wall biosynthesis
MLQIYNELIPEVSVVMASFNRAEYLPRCIGSLLAQTYNSWELIFVDDGSNDDSFKVMNNYMKKFENVRYIKHKNKKLALTRNTGIVASVGNFITFLDSDDEYEPNHLAIRMKIMNENPEVDLIHGGVKIIGNPFVADKYDPTKLIHLDECVIGGTFFGKRKMFGELGGFKNLPYSEDSDFFERAEKEYKIFKTDAPTYIYHRDAPDSITNKLLHSEE